jgi:hypothetical protein
MQTESSRDYPGIAFAAGFVALGVWTIAETRGMSDFGAIFPRTIGFAMITFAVAFIVLTLVKPPRAGTVPQGGSTPRRMALVVLLVAWILLLPVVGFYVTSLVAFLVLCFIANYDALTARIVLIWTASAFGVVTAFYLLFAKALLVPLPKGLIL